MINPISVLPTNRYLDNKEVIIWFEDCTVAHGWFALNVDYQPVWRVANQYGDLVAPASNPTHWMYAGFELLTAMPELALVTNERIRQVCEEGYDQIHDDQFNDRGDLANAAINYLKVGIMQRNGMDEEDFRLKNWPWDREAWKPSGSPLRNYTIAAALLLAEIGRLSREQS